MNKTKAQLEAELRELQTTWIPPHRYAELQTDLVNREEQLATVKTARQHLETEAEGLRKLINELRRKLQGSEEELSAMEGAVEDLVPGEYLDDQYQGLQEPLRLYVETLQANQVGTVKPNTTVKIPLTVEVRLQHGRDDR